MVDLGMTPVLPAFTGFVPRSLPKLFPDTKFVNGSRWNDFSPQYTNDTFLEPEDPLFAELQQKVIAKQQKYLGTVTHVWTLDQFNENDPGSGDLEYLRNTTLNTWKSLKAADPQAIWLIQGWLFFSNADFWTNERVKAYLDGVENDQDMLILDLFSETQPQWQRLDGYYGKPWIWCQLHNYGGNMGLYGQVENVTVNPIEALSNSTSMVGMGLTMEGQEGNEVMYDLLLDQAWHSQPINTTSYFSSFASSRYGPSPIPPSILEAWNILLHTVYNNTNLTTQAVTKSILELRPNSTGLLDRVGHHPTTLTYDPSTLVKAWTLLLDGASESPSLWSNPPFTLDLADVTRQVLANIFPTLYTSFLSSVTPTPHPTASSHGTRPLALLDTLDRLLSAAHPSFHLSTWENSARAWAMDSPLLSTSNTDNTSTNASTTTTSDFLVYNARNQITLWGPAGEISDYASKSWAGLVGQFYRGHWELWVREYEQLGESGVNRGTLEERLLAWEEDWVGRGLGGIAPVATDEDGGGKRDVLGESLEIVIADVRREWKMELGC